MQGQLRAAMERDEQVLLIGEDIEGPYGGAFKCDEGPEPTVSWPRAQYAHRVKDPRYHWTE